ncbi:MAG: SpoIID/LytB domain-containing protein [Actinobacteria bacterium]|nr:SpoIID/LytB domain-containing protein [Actinomycetota bacterium]
MQIAAKTRQRVRLAAGAFACALIAALPAALASEASAKPLTWVLRGHGYGHGIGMSQYGAQGYALQGRNYKQILGHYYTDTSIGQSSTSTIRVILRQGVSSVSVTGATRATGGKQLDVKKTYAVKRDAGSIKIYDGGDLVESYDNGLLITDGGDPVTLNGTAIGGVRNGRYRGGLEFSESALGGMNVVNAVDLDDYVQGVVPGEVPTSWHAEALKTQAVAARSYALATDAGGALFDQYPDTRSQVYRGAGAEVASTNAAVRDTAGEVVKYADKVIAAYFFSTSGGRTENIENVWQSSKPVPYLKSVEDPYDDASPKHNWAIRYSQATMQAKLGNLVKGRLKAIKVVQRGVSPRVMKADVIGTGGRVRTDGTTLRARLGLFDTWVSFTRTRR